MLLREKVGWSAFHTSKQPPLLTYLKLSELLELSLRCWCCPGILFCGHMESVVLPGFPVRSVAPGTFVKLAGGTNPEQPYAYILQWPEPLCIPLGRLTSMAAAGTAAIAVLICHVDATFWCVQETLRPQIWSHFWRVCLTRTGCSATRCLHCSWSVGGWYCTRTSRVFFSLLS